MADNMMDLALFSLADGEIQVMRQALEEAVNEAIGDALRRRLYSADVTLKIGVQLKTYDGENGAYLQPEYSFKTGWKIGGKYEGGKGKTDGTVGIRVTKEGYIETVPLPEQMSMAT